MKNMPFLEFVRELKNLCQTEVSGTLFITAENNKIVQIDLNKGQIVFMSMLGKTGLDALPLIKQISNCSYQLLGGTVSKTRVPLPATADILQMLTVTGQDQKTNLGDISAQAKTVLKETLNEFLGPVASFVCDQHLAKVGDLQAAITILAGEIPDKSDAIRFKEIVQNRLKGGMVTGQDGKTSLGSISAQAKTVLKETLNEFLGPVASFVCDQHLAKVGDLQAAITILAGEIPDKSDAIKFKEIVQKKLKNMT